MNKVIASLSAVSAMIGISLTARTDISFALPVGMIFIAVAGVFLYITIKTWEQHIKTERIQFLEKLALSDIKDSVNVMTENMSTVSAVSNDYKERIIAQLNKNHSALISFMETIVVQQQREMMELQISKIDKAINEVFKERKEINKELKNIPKSFDAFKDQISAISTIVTSDIEKHLKELTETQQGIADDISNSIERIAEKSIIALEKIPASLIEFDKMNAETMKKTIDSFEQFKTLLETTVKQLTEISEQDYTLLKGMLSE